jgi:hypothetical protein
VARWGGNGGGGSRGEGATWRNSAVWLCSSRGASGAADAWALAGSGRGREERGAGARGPTQRKHDVGRARMNSDDFEMEFELKSKEL